MPEPEEKVSTLKTFFRIASLAHTAFTHPDFPKDSQVALDALRKAVAISEPGLKQVEEILARHSALVDRKDRKARDRDERGVDKAEPMKLLLKGASMAWKLFGRTKGKDSPATLEIMKRLHAYIDDSTEETKRDIRRLERVVEGKHKRRRRRRRQRGSGDEEGEDAAEDDRQGLKGRDSERPAQPNEGLQPHGEESQFQPPQAPEFAPPHLPQHIPGVAPSIRSRPVSQAAQYMPPQNQQPEPRFEAQAPAFNVPAPNYGAQAAMEPPYPRGPGMIPNVEAPAAANPPYPQGQGAMPNPEAQAAMHPLSFRSPGVPPNHGAQAAMDPPYPEGIGAMPREPSVAPSIASSYSRRTLAPTISSSQSSRAGSLRPHAQAEYQHPEPHIQFADGQAQSTASRSHRSTRDHRSRVSDRPNSHRSAATEELPSRHEPQPKTIPPTFTNSGQGTHHATGSSYIGSKASSSARSSARHGHPPPSVASSSREPVNVAHLPSVAEQSLREGSRAPTDQRSRRTSQGSRSGSQGESAHRTARMPTTSIASSTPTIKPIRPSRAANTVPSKARSRRTAPSVGSGTTAPTLQRTPSTQRSKPRSHISRAPSTAIDDEDDVSEASYIGYRRPKPKPRKCHHPLTIRHEYEDTCPSFAEDCEVMMDENGEWVINPDHGGCEVCEVADIVS